MAAGEPLLTTDVELFLQHLLGGDPELLTYLPDGAASTAPPDGQAIVPVVRFWEQSAGTALARQDGRAGRVVSSPTWIVVALDRQTQGQNDRLYGSLGGAFEPPREYLRLAQRRLYTILHARRETFGGFRWTLQCPTPYARTDDPVKGWNDVLVGWWVRMTVV